MKIEVHREACCFQDDQMGPLDQSFELPDASTLADFLDAVASSRFLQYSSTHVTMDCHIGGQVVAAVSSPSLLWRPAPVFTTPPQTPMRQIAVDGKAEFIFQRGRRVALNAG